MLTLCAQSTAVYSGACSPSFNPNHDHRRRRLPSQVRLRHRRSNVHVFSIDQSDYFQTNAKVQYDSSQNLRTLFPGGYKRPEIKVPSLVLKLSADEILKDKAALDKVDEAVAKTVGVVLLDGGDSSGGRLYEAACLLKSVIRDRAYLVISERVDIAAAIGASGVVLSDQGLPTVVARKTMLDSRSGSVVLPLVARTVQTSSDALRASSAEGADFLIYSIDPQDQADELAKSVLNSVKVPIFVNGASFGVDILHSEGANLLKEGASGFVVSLCDLGFFSGGVLDSLFLLSYPSDKGELPEISGKLKLLNVENGMPMTKGVAGFSRLEEKEKLLLEQEKLILLEAIDIIQRAAPLMGEVSLLIDAVSQLDEPFLLVIVVIVC